MSKETVNDMIERLARRELEALNKCMEDPELMIVPAIQANVRRFLAQNKVETNLQTPEAKKLIRSAIDIPIFDVQ